MSSQVPPPLPPSCPDQETPVGRSLAERPERREDHHRRKCSAGFRSCRNILAPTVGPRRKTPRIFHMVTARNMTGNDRNAKEETSHLDPMTLILKIQREMDLLKKKSEEEIKALRKENARMKQKLAERPTILEAADDIPSGDHVNADTHEIGSSYQGNMRPILYNALGTSPRMSPFADTVLEVPLPGTWSNSTLDKYDGTTDPDEHVNAYLTQVGLHTAEDTLWCRIFPTSLKGAALSWFTRVPAQSIDCFDTVHRLF